MAYDRIRTRHGRNSGRNRQILSIPQQDWRGVNAVDGIYAMPANQIPPAQNVDLGNPIGDIAKVAGYESLFASLGVGPVRGLHAWEHSDGDKLIFAWDKYLYLLSGDAGSIAKGSQADWEEGEGTNVDTEASPGDIQIAKTGVDFSATATNTADFNGTHSGTVATSNSVKLQPSPDGNTRYYIQNAAGGLDPTDRGDWNATYAIVRKLDKTKYGSVAYRESNDASDTENYDRMLVKAVSDGLPTDKIISGTLSWCFGVQESSASANFYYHVHAFVTSGDTNSVRGTLLSDYIGEVEWGTTALGLAVGAQAINSVNAKAGDRIVIEIGFCGKNTVSTEYFGRIYYGGTNATDLTDGGNVTTYPGWFEFSSDPMLPNYVSSGIYTHPVQNISVAGVTKEDIKIIFNKTTPDNTACTVETRISTNGGSSWGAWTERSSGDTLITAGTDVSSCRVQWRSNLSSTTGSSTPSLDDVKIEALAAYKTEAVWEYYYDLGVTPNTATLSYTVSAPAGTSVTVFAAGSSNGTVFGDWQLVATSGDAVPRARYIKLKFLLTGTISATPKASDFLIGHSTSFTTPNRLDISPLGRTDNKLTGNRVSCQNYDDRLYCADGLRPFVLYVDDDIAATGTAQGGAAGYITLAAGASAVDGFYNNAFITLTGGTGAGQVRFISGYDGSTKRATVSEDWDTAPDATSTYSIGPAVKARNAGVDPPASACTAADGGGTGITGTFRYKITFVNRDGYESNPSGASNSINVSNKTVALSNIPTGDSTIAARKVYRTKTGGSVYYYVDTIDDNTTTTYSDTTADASLVTLMLDNNNIPPNCSLAYLFVTYMFYVFMDELWYAKATEVEAVPAIVGDVQSIICPAKIADIKSNPMALVPMGEDFIAPITSNSGFIFDSDPLVDSTTMRQIGRSGSTSAWASDICVTPDLRSILTFPTRAGVMTILPGLQDGSIDSFPLSRNVQTYFDRSVDWESMAGIFHNGRYRISFKYLAPGASEAVWVTFICDFRQETREWSGPWTYGASCYAVIDGELYAGDPEEGKVYLMDTGNSFDGDKIHMIADARMISPKGENNTYKFNKFMFMVSADSDTSELLIKPKVDNREVSVVPGTLEDTFTGERRAGHDNIRSRKYRIPLAKGSTLSYRFEDDSTNPICIQKIITEAELLPLKR